MKFGVTVLPDPPWQRLVALMQLAAGSGVTVRGLSVQSPTLDDVFVHYTGHALRDALQAPSAADSPFMLRRN